MGLRLLARGPVRAACAAMVLLAGLPGVAAADVCMTIDETMDTFTPKDRMAALLLLARQFELAGERVVAPGCQTAYVVSHVQLGDSITITLIGPNGRRDAVAVGMNDVAAVYSQMLRSLLTGQPMNGGGIVDRTNVSEGQTRQRRVSADSVAYARLGFGAIFGDRVYSGPAVGVFGYRKELDAFAIDVSFLNFQYQSSQSADLMSAGTNGMTGAWLKLEALRFTSPQAARSSYFGGGLSWSGAHLNHGYTTLEGSGLQGEVTVGHELGRASTIRVFVQADIGLPFYRLRSVTHSYASGPSFPYLISVVNRDRYAPNLNVSLGLGWQRGGGR